MKGKRYTAVLAVLALIMALSGTVYANSVIMVPVLSLAVGLPSIEFEWQRDATTAWALSGNFVTVSDGSLSVTGLGAGFGVHKYFGRTLLNGPYVGASGTFASISGKDSITTEMVSINGVVAMGRAGWKFNSAGRGLTVDIYGSVAIPLYVSASGGGETISAAGLMGVATGVEIAVGWAW